MNRRLFSLLLLFVLLAIGAGAAQAQSSPALWFVTYWNNADLEGDPAHTESVGNIDYNWGTAQPHPTVEADTWSARWTAFVDLPAGTYRFTTTSDDGVRVYVGNKHIIVDWNEHPTRTNVATVSLIGGRYPIAVDYFDDVGHAELEFGWERIGPAAAGAADVTIVTSGPIVPQPTSGGWQATYWNNTALQGNPLLVRNEAAIDNNWGTGSPAAVVPTDNWSARWTSSPYFPAGTYRFTATMDDGMRVWVDNVLIIDAWFTSPAHTITVDRELSEGTHTIRVEYFEAGGNAVARLSWQRIGGPPVGGGGVPTALVNTAWLNIRVGPGISYQRFDVLPFGTVVSVLGRNADASWVQVMLPDGRTGWMSTAFLAGNTQPFNSLPVVTG